MSPLSTYLHLFSHLHTAVGVHWSADTRHKAPNKPLLLLAILDSFAQGLITSGLVEPSPDLLDLFNIYWYKVMPVNRRGNFAMPFFHMRREPFWELVPVPGKEAALGALTTLTSVGQLRELILGARLAPDLLDLLRTAQSREALRRILVETSFAPHLHAVLLEQGTINQEAYQYSLFLYAEALQGQPLEKDLVRAVVRDQGFRKAIVKVYEHRCAICGVRVLSPDGHTAVTAAHIIPWSVSQDDNIQNGLALCPFCHWTFDEGLASVSQAYRVLISKYLQQNPNLPGHLPTLDNREIFRPAEPHFWPSQSNLLHHRKHIWRP